MFDWNDEELTNIIWDEADDTGDHIVPYPVESEVYCKRKWSQEFGNVKSCSQKETGAKVDHDGRKLENKNFKLCEGTSVSGLDMELWPNLSLSNAAKTDQDSMDTSVSNNLTDITKFNSSGEETAHHDKDTEIFRDPHEVKDQGDFGDYGWASIGSFDDLDQIFSNDDPIFGNASLGNADELWSSSKDVANSPVKSFPISVGSRPEYAQEEDPLFTLGYGKVYDAASHSLQNAQAALEPVEYAGGKSKPIGKEQTGLAIMRKNLVTNSQLTADNVAVSNESANKVYRQKKHFKGRKKLEDKGEVKSFHDLYANWTSPGMPAGQLKNQFTPQILRPSPSSSLSQQQQLQGPEQLQYKQISNPFVASSAYGSITNPYSALPLFSQIQSGEFKHQPLLSGYEVSSGNANAINKSADSAAKPQTMTPQEKIEKLRRRQQIQAMLAIQKQQQQFAHQVSCGDQSITPKCSQEKPTQQVDGADLEVEDLSTLASFDPNSPIDQDDSSSITLSVNGYSLEDTILYRLQDIISKLDVRVRLCIRDSLFRLAQSATHRNYASDTCSTNNSVWDEQATTKEETGSHNRTVKIPEVETETNPLDRTVAHLLFHRPMDLSAMRPGTPESPVSTKLPIEQKTAGIAKLSMGSLPETPKSKLNFSQQGSKISSLLTSAQSADHCESNLCFDTSENALNNGNAGVGAREVEASH